MKPLLITACIAGLLLLPRASTGQTPCRVTVNAQVEVAPGKLALADVLAADTCTDIARAAAAVDLGSAPLVGSVRVLAGTEVRARLEKLAGSMQDGALQLQAMKPIPEMFIPDRISIRRAGARASCADIRARLLASSEVFPWAPRPANSRLAGLMDCGAAGRIAQETPVRPTRTVWDSVLASWEVSARCVRSTDCVPFLVRVPGSGSPAERALASSAASKVEPVALAEKPVVRAGETVTLLWDQDGIRLTVPAICLDAGAEGQRVRARIGSGGRTLPAIVISAGVLRAAS